MRAWQLALVGACVALAACSAKPRAVVVDRTADRPGSARPNTPPPRATPTRGEYVVARGDTLYGIAFRHGVDFRELANRNGIPSPYTIYPGQRLKISAGSVASAPRPAAPVTRPPLSTPAAPPVSSPNAPAVVTTPAATPLPTATSPTAPISTAPNTTPINAPPAEPVTTPIASGASRSVDGLTWRWPAAGQVVGKYVVGDPTRQGINIAGNAGQAVNAAADGEVVYSGSGLIGYGELIIIKHSDTFLSAYGHNRKRLVSEGQKVKAGQQIAEMGRSGAARDMLHFEIRKNGKPIDPSPFLPAK